ncbi:hypothetical protein [Streptococcus dentiloxodontae]
MRRVIKTIILIILVLGCIIGIRALYFFVFGQPGDTSHVNINYGHSRLYSQKERKAAAKVILRKFASFENCQLEKLSYTSDEQSKEELASRKEGDAKRYQEGYDKKDNSKTYDDCIVFTSSFTTGSDPDPGFSPNDHYTAWSWTLVRKKGGQWHLISYGQG